MHACVRARMSKAISKTHPAIWRVRPRETRPSRMGTFKVGGDACRTSWQKHAGVHAHACIFMHAHAGFFLEITC